MGCKRHVWALPPSHKRQPIDLELNKIDVPQSGAQPSAPRPRWVLTPVAILRPSTQPPTHPAPSKSTHTYIPFRTLTMAGAKMYRVVIAWIERSSFSRRKGTTRLLQVTKKRTSDPQPERERERERAPSTHRVLAQWEGRTTLSAPRFSFWQLAGIKSCRRKIKRNALLADSLYFEIDTCVSAQKRRSCLRHFFHYFRCSETRLKFIPLWVKNEVVYWRESIPENMRFMFHQMKAWRPSFPHICTLLKKTNYCIEDTFC